MTLHHNHHDYHSHRLWIIEARGSTQQPDDSRHTPGTNGYGHPEPISERQHQAPPEPTERRGEYIDIGPLDQGSGGSSGGGNGDGDYTSGDGW